MKDGIRYIIGKTIASVAVVENRTSPPRNQIFLIFKDGTSFEIYGNQFTCCSGIDNDDLDKIKAMIEGNSGSSKYYS